MSADNTATPAQLAAAHLDTLPAFRQLEILMAIQEFTMAATRPINPEALALFVLSQTTPFRGRA